MTPLPCLLIYGLCNCLWFPTSAGLGVPPLGVPEPSVVLLASLSLSLSLCSSFSVILAFPSHLSYPPFLFHRLHCLSSLIPSFAEQDPALDPTCPQDLSTQPEVGKISVGALLSRQVSQLYPNTTALPYKRIKPFPSTFPRLAPRPGICSPPLPPL